MVTQLLLKWNGYQFQLEQNELADMFIGIADGTKDETELRYWINGNRQTTLRMDRHETIVAERYETFRYYCIVGVLG